LNTHPHFSFFGGKLFMIGWVLSTGEMWFFQDIPMHALLEKQDPETTGPGTGDPPGTP